MKALWVTTILLALFCVVQAVEDNVPMPIIKDSLQYRSNALAPKEMPQEMEDNITELEDPSSTVQIGSSDPGDAASAPEPAPEPVQEPSPETEQQASPETEQQASPETEQQASPETEQQVSPETEQQVSPETEQQVSPETEPEVVEPPPEPIEPVLDPPSTPTISPEPVNVPEITGGQTEQTKQSGDEDTQQQVVSTSAESEEEEKPVEVQPFVEYHQPSSRETSSGTLVSTSEDIQKPKGKSTSSAAGAFLFALLALALVAVIGVGALKYMRKRREKLSRWEALDVEMTERMNF